MLPLALRPVNQPVQLHARGLALEQYYIGVESSPIPPLRRQERLVVVAQLALQRGMFLACDTAVEVGGVALGENGQKDKLVGVAVRQRLPVREATVSFEPPC